MRGKYRPSITRSRVVPLFHVSCGNACARTTDIRKEILPAVFVSIHLSMCSQKGEARRGQISLHKEQKKQRLYSAGFVQLGNDDQDK